MITLAFVVCAYLIGSVSFAVLMSKVFGLADPRTYGSGNPGATNVLRSGKKAAAALTLLGDAAKGWLAVFLALRFAPHDGEGLMIVALVSIAVFARPCISRRLRTTPLARQHPTVFRSPS